MQKRLKFLCSTTDGFAVAQYDLETRGPGDFFGSRQHGLPTLQIADLMNDTRTLHAAQSEALPHAGGGPAAGRPGPRPAGRTGTADVRQGRADELKKRCHTKNSCDSAFFTLFHSDDPLQNAGSQGIQLCFQCGQAQQAVEPLIHGIHRVARHGDQQHRASQVSQRGQQRPAEPGQVYQSPQQRPGKIAVVQQYTPKDSGASRKTQRRQ